MPRRHAGPVLHLFDRVELGGVRQELGPLPVATAKEARRFLDFEEMILHFAIRAGLGIFTNNEAERTIRPVKVQQLRRMLAHPPRTAAIAVVQSHLSTAAKWGISNLDARRGLLNGRAWIPPGLEPAG